MWQQARSMGQWLTQCLTALETELKIGRFGIRNKRVFIQNNFYCWISFFRTRVRIYYHISDHLTCHSLGSRYLHQRSRSRTGQFWHRAIICYPWGCKTASYVVLLALKARMRIWAMQSFRKMQFLEKPSLPLCDILVSPNKGIALLWREMTV